MIGPDRSGAMKWKMIAKAIIPPPKNPKKEATMFENDFGQR